jgi:putative molybdopterin biosynthesis protein
MPRTTLLSSLRQRRIAAGMRQAELAERLGVSRQSLSAIESGGQVPSTALSLHMAALLGCRVEDLFCLDTPAACSALLARSAKRTSPVMLARVDERWVAHPMPSQTWAADGILWADGVSGEWGQIERLPTGRDTENHLLIAGCAPLLKLCAERLEQMVARIRVTWIPATSEEALSLLQAGLVHVAGAHLTRESSPTGNLQRADALDLAENARMVHLARWQQGFVLPTGNPLGVRGADDLARADLRFALRAPGAVARDLWDSLRAEIGATQMGEGIHAANHQEVANLVRYGRADTGIAIETVALEHALDFIPLTQESFDLFCTPSPKSPPALMQFLDLLSSGDFHREASRMPGYDCARMGESSTLKDASRSGNVP